jgi:ubiquinone/menaquinone biosynthesis C-methylase UbiE
MWQKHKNERSAMREDDLQRAAELWGDERRASFYESRVMWEQIGAVQRRINQKISGNPDVDWIEYIKRTHLAGRTPVEHCLSLCCWQGELERELARRGVFRTCTAYDISRVALSRAREKAALEGIDGVEYVLQDVNTMVLAAGQFDLVVARAALHHIAELEHVLEQINRGLKPEGIFVALEYVGPNRFGFSRRQLEIANCALRLLPERFRHNISWQRLGRLGPGGKRSFGAWLRLLWLKLRNRTLLQALGRRVYHCWLRMTGQAHIKRSVPRIVGSEMAVDDPTEAVRSADIRPLIEEKLQVIEYKPYGGTILMPLLDDIAGNFCEDDPAARELLDMLFTIEDALMAAGEIDSDFAFIVARKKAS